MNMMDVQQSINVPGKMIVELYLPHCVPCKKMKETVFPQLKDVPVLFVDCSDDQDVFNFFVESCESDIQGVPCVLLYENGKFLRRKDGYMDIDTLNKFVEIV